MAEQNQRSAAYVPWGTFRNSIDRLSEGLPHQIQPSVFPTLAGGTTTQLIAAYKFLGLIEEESHKPTASLRELVKQDELERKPLLKKILEETYADLIALDLKKATLEQVNETMEKSYGVGGSTRTKAVRFFLHGAKHVGIEVSPFLEKAKGTIKGRPRPKRKSKGGTVKPNAGAAPTTGESKTVRLGDIGELTLSANLNFFSLSAEQREFVFGLIAQMEEYEAKHRQDDDENGNGWEEEVQENEGEANRE